MNDDDGTRMQFLLGAAALSIAIAAAWIFNHSQYGARWHGEQAAKRQQLSFSWVAPVPYADCLVVISGAVAHKKRGRRA
jgi:hypothetical protein